MAQPHSRFGSFREDLVASDIPAELLPTLKERASGRIRSHAVGAMLGLAAACRHRSQTPPLNARVVDHNLSLMALQEAMRIAKALVRSRSIDSPFEFTSPDRTSKQLSDGSADRVHPQTRLNALTSLPLSLMAPLAIFHWHNLPDAERAAEQLAISYSASPLTRDACRFSVRLLCKAIRGPQMDVFGPMVWNGAPEIIALANGGWRTTSPTGPESPVVQTMSAALNIVSMTEGVAHALEHALEKVGEGSAVVPIVGQLAGALHCFDFEDLTHLGSRDPTICACAEALFDAGFLARQPDASTR